MQAIYAVLCILDRLGRERKREMEFNLRAHRGNIGYGANEIGLYAWQEKQDGLYAAQPLILKEHKRRYEESQPFLTISDHEAQQLMDSLWDCGLRPSEGSGSAGAMLATQKHLEDMRTLVFKKK